MKPYYTSQTKNGVDVFVREYRSDAYRMLRGSPFPEAEAEALCAQMDKAFAWGAADDWAGWHD